MYPGTVSVPFLCKQLPCVPINAKDEKQSQFVAIPPKGLGEPLKLPNIIALGTIVCFKLYRHEILFVGFSLVNGDVQFDQRIADPLRGFDVLVVVRIDPDGVRLKDWLESIGKFGRDRSLDTPTL